MTYSKMNLIMEIIEKDLKIEVENIRGNSSIYGLIFSFEKYDTKQLIRIQKFIKEYQDLFEKENIIDLIKNNAIWAK